MTAVCFGWDNSRSHLARVDTRKVVIPSLTLTWDELTNTQYKRNSNFHYFFEAFNFCNSLHITHIIHNNTILFFWQKNLKFLKKRAYTYDVTYYTITSYIPLYSPPLSFFEEKKSYILYDNYYMKWKLAPNEIQMELFFTFLFLKIIIISHYLMYTKCHQNLTLNLF